MSRSFGKAIREVGTFCSGRTKLYWYADAQGDGFLCATLTSRSFCRIARTLIKRVTIVDDRVKLVADHCCANINPLVCAGYSFRSRKSGVPLPMRRKLVAPIMVKDILMIGGGLFEG